MSTSTLNQSKVVSSESLQQLSNLYNQGLYLQAYQLTNRIKPLQRWTAAIEEQIWAGRLAYQIGAPRLGRLLHLRAGRRDPSHPEAAYFYCRALLEKQGPLKAWEFLHQWQTLESCTSEQQAQWLGLKANILGCLRDFDRADSYLQQAQTLNPCCPWLAVEQAWLLQRQDRYVEALEVIQESLIANPWHRVGVSLMGHLLILQEQPEQALELLQTASQRLESSLITQQLAQLQKNLEDYLAAQASYDRYVTLMPLMEPEVQQHLWASKSDIAYALGDYAEAVTWARQVKAPFYQTVADRLSQEPLQGKRVVLPVGFIRQHHMTCAPATLAMVGRYWEQPVDHLKIAEEICYNGTSSWSERNWAEQNGYVVREFSLTWESAVALIDRGIPITVSTVETTSAHLQAIIGYDSFLQQFLIRDPYLPSLQKNWAPGFLEYYAAFGPRAMVLVPLEQSSLLENLDLPDDSLYDALYQLETAIKDHQRGKAVEICQTFAQLAPNHRLNYLAQRAIAIYDGDSTRILEINDLLLALFPNHEIFLHEKLSCLQELARKEDRLELLQSICDRQQTHPTFWQAYAEELGKDIRTIDQAKNLLRRSIRCTPEDSESYASLADLLWSQQAFQEAFELYRFATCLSTTHPRYARSYFLAARHFNQTDAALSGHTQLNTQLNTIG